MFLITWNLISNGQSQSLKKREIFIVPSTHWDRVWLKPYEIFRMQEVNMMDHLVDLMKRRRDYLYFTLDGQISLVDDYLEIRPGAKNEVEKLIKEGRLQIGPWYTQPNVFMVSGESIIRNLYLGIHKGLEYGKVLNVCYLPDCFGLNSQLPQIIHGFGISDVYFERGIPKSYQGLFKWRGSDGTECFALNYPYKYGNSAFAQETVADEAGKMKFLNLFDRYFKEDISTNSLPYSVVMNGFDMQWAIDDLPEKVDFINQNRNDLNAQISDFPFLLKELKDYNQKNKLGYKLYTGEIREHTGRPIIPASQSTRTDLKIANRMAEGLLEKYTEPICSFLWMSGYKYPQPEINKVWFYLLNNQHHDNTAAASSDNDYHAVMVAIERVGEIGNELVRKSTSLIATKVFKDMQEGKNEYGFVAFNTLGWKRSGVEDIAIDIPDSLNIRTPVLLDGDKEFILYPDDFESTLQYNMQNNNGGVSYSPAVKRYKVSVPLNNIPAFGYKTFKIADKKAINSPWEAYHRKTLKTGVYSAENSYLKININTDGTINIFDKRTNWKYSKVHYFQDDGEAGSGFEHRRPMKDEVITTLGVPARISLVDDTPFKITYRVEWEIKLPKELDQEYLRRSVEYSLCRIVSYVTLKDGIPRIDIKTEINNASKNHRLRIAFPTNLKTDSSWAEQPFDVVKRPITLQKDQWKGEENFNFPIDASHPMNSFVDLSNGKNGLMVVNTGLPLYEVSNDSSKTVLIDMIRSIGVIHSRAIQQTKELAIPEAQMLGEHTFKYSIIPHEGEWDRALKEAYNYQFPLHITTPLFDNTIGKELLYLGLNRTDLGKMPPEYSFIKVDNPNILVSAIKKHETEDALVIRLYNPTSAIQETKCEINPLEYKVDGICEINFMEEPKSEDVTTENSIRLKFLPKKIITLMIKFSHNKI